MSHTAPAFKNISYFIVFKYKSNTCLRQEVQRMPKSKGKKERPSPAISLFTREGLVTP